MTDECSYKKTTEQCVGQVALSRMLFTTALQKKGCLNRRGICYLIWQDTIWVSHVGERRKCFEPSPAASHGVHWQEPDLEEKKLGFKSSTLFWDADTCSSVLGTVPNAT